MGIPPPFSKFDLDPKYPTHGGFIPFQEQQHALEIQHTMANLSKLETLRSRSKCKRTLTNPLHLFGYWQFQACNHVWHNVWSKYYLCFVLTWCVIVLYMSQTNLTKLLNSILHELFVIYMCLLWAHKTNKVRFSRSMFTLEAPIKQLSKKL